MPQFTREQLFAYLDDALDEGETAEIEQALRTSQPLREQLRKLMQERDRGEHSVGAIWRQQRLSCPTRDELGSYLLGALDTDYRDYIAFHLKTIGCAYCLANYTDLETRQKEAPDKVEKRRRKVYDSGAGLLRRSSDR